MLSRLAESLFWIGRYIERAEDTARLLDVHVHLLLEDVATDPEETCRDLLAVMGVPAPESGVDIRTVTELLAFDPDTTASIVRSLTAARENARGARDTISGEMFHCLNRTYHAVPAEQRTARLLGPGSFFTFVKQRGAELHGLADSTMSRDEGWLFLVLGRSLERIDMTARLLATGIVDASSSTALVTLLRCCSAHEAYLRTYRGPVHAARVAEFLVLDRLFPRSVYSALCEAERCVTELRPLVGRAGVADDARRALGRARTDLEYRRTDELVEDLPARLTMLQNAVAAAAEAVAARYFRSASAVTWQQEVPV
ncbi:MAG TPA: alpha-E domain-containing protein [Mycobacteriales bacterium]|nr:alpha-E domain-containing protein [Mycobacteriales bacterium]